MSRRFRDWLYRLALLQGRASGWTIRCRRSRGTTLFESLSILGLCILLEAACARAIPPQQTPAPLTKAPSRSRRFSLDQDLLRHAARRAAQILGFTVAVDDEAGGVMTLVRTAPDADWLRARLLVSPPKIAGGTAYLTLIVLPSPTGARIRCHALFHLSTPEPSPKGFALSNARLETEFLDQVGRATDSAAGSMVPLPRPATEHDQDASATASPFQVPAIDLRGVLMSTTSRVYDSTPQEVWLAAAEACGARHLVTKSDRNSGILVIETVFQERYFLYLQEDLRAGEAKTRLTVYPEWSQVLDEVSDILLLGNVWLRLKAEQGAL